jgi:protein TonB
MSVRTLCFTCVGLALASGASAARAAKLDDVRLAFAQAVHEASPEYIHQRNPQPLLRAVVVLNVKLQEGDHWQAEVVRTNEQQPEMLQRAMDTVARARVPEVPAELREHLQRNGIYETWLFDKDGSFQVKTLAKAQLMGR